MAGQVDITARIAAISYTVVIAAGVWFTLAWTGSNEHWHFGELLAFVGFALSPVLVCVLCFRRDA